MTHRSPEALRQLDPALGEKISIIKNRMYALQVVFSKHFNSKLTKWVLISQASKCHTEIALVPTKHHPALMQSVERYCVSHFSLSSNLFASSCNAQQKCYGSLLVITVPCVRGKNKQHRGVVCTQTYPHY